MKKHLINIILGAAVCLTTVSCESFLDGTPLDKADAKTYFSTETQIELYCRGILEGYAPSAERIATGDDKYCDLVASKSSQDFYRPGVYTPGLAGGWSWTLLRRANYMLEGIAQNAKGKIFDNLYNHYEGVGRFWRAFVYFDRVNTYGNVPWCDHVPANGEDILFKTQDDRELVMHNVLADLTFASENCLATSKYVTPGRVYINKWVALALKARVCLYEGTFRKYNKVNPSTHKPWNNSYETADDFLREAAAAAEEIMNDGPFSIHKTSDPSTAFSELFLSENFCEDEVIWGRQYSTAATTYNDITWRYNSATYDQMPSPTKDLVDMYLTLDGTPIIDDKVLMTDEFTNRDWRLSQTVNAPGHTYITNAGKVWPKSPDASVTRTGYAFVKWCVERQANYSAGKAENSLPSMRLAEVLLIYAEAKAELGLMTPSIWDTTVGELRKRAGVTNIYPDGAGYVADTWLQDYYSGSPIALSNTILEIRRERATELIMEMGLRSRDIKRWGMGSLIVTRNSNNQGWRGIYVTQDAFTNGFTFNGTKYTFVTSGKASATKFLVPNTGKDLSWSLTEGDHGYLIYNYKLEWAPEDMMLLSPISTADINLNKQLVQNYGWDKR